MSTAKWRIDGFVKVNHPHARLIEAARKALEAAAKQFEFMLSIMDQQEGSEFYTNASSECKSRLGECSAALNLLGEVK